MHAYTYTETWILPPVTTHADLFFARVSCSLFYYFWFAFSPPFYSITKDLENKWFHFHLSMSMLYMNVYICIHVYYFVYMYIYLCIHVYIVMHAHIYTTWTYMYVGQSFP